MSSLIATLVAVELKSKSRKPRKKKCVRPAGMSDKCWAATKINFSKGGPARKAKAEALYLPHFSLTEPITTEQVAAKIGRNADTARNHIAVLESRDLIHRVGTKPREGKRGQPAILWLLGPKPTDKNNE